MFDIGWSELLVIAVVAILVVGPKDLPGMLRAFGKTMNQVRRTANDFKRQFNDALNEAETESGLKETTDQLKSIGSINPVADVKDSLNELKKDVSVMDDDPGAVDTIDEGSADPSTDGQKTDAGDASPKPDVKSGSDAA